MTSDQAAHYKVVSSRSTVFTQGSYRQVLVNSKTFQGLLKPSPTVFKDSMLMTNTDLSVKILHQKS